MPSAFLRVCSGDTTSWCGQEATHVLFDVDGLSHFGCLAHAAAHVGHKMDLPAWEAEYVTGPNAAAHAAAEQQRLAAQREQEALCVLGERLFRGAPRARA